VPALTRWFVRAGMAYLLATLLIGVGLHLPSAREIPVLAVLWPTYIHVLVVGWLTQLIFGVAFSMFPKHSQAQPRGSERLGWANFVLLNGGLVLRLVGEPWRALGGPTGGLLVASAVAQLLAGWAFVVNTGPRTRAR
jgi:hypothetical protein